MEREVKCTDLRDRMPGFHTLALPLFGHIVLDKKLNLMSAMGIVIVHSSEDCFENKLS